MKCTLVRWDRRTPYDLLAVPTDETMDVDGADLDAVFVNAATTMKLLNPPTGWWEFLDAVVQHKFEQWLTAHKVSCW